MNALIDTISHYLIETFISVVMFLIIKELNASKLVHECRYDTSPNNERCDGRIVSKKPVYGQFEIIRYISDEKNYTFTDFSSISIFYS
jgi:hypothetical protein